MNHLPKFKKLPLLVILLMFRSLQADFNVKMFEDSLNSVSKRTIKEVESEIAYLKIAGMGGSLSPENQIYYEKLVFQSNKILKESEGILLIKKIVTTYLKNFNSEPTMSEYRKKFSFDRNNLVIFIDIMNSDGTDVYDPNIRYFIYEEDSFRFAIFSKSLDLPYDKCKWIIKPYENTLGSSTVIEQKNNVIQ